MRVCCAVGCSKLASHTFPKDPDLLKRWCIAINRVTENNKLWYPTQWSRLCSAHFVPEDFAIPMIPSGDQPRKRLKPGVVPTVFMHKSGPSKASITSYQRRELQQRKVGEARLAKRNTEAEISPDSSFGNLDEVQHVDVANQEMKKPFDEGCQIYISTTSQMDAQEEEDLNLGFGIEAYKSKPDSIQYFTGFLDYDHFNDFFSYLGPAAMRLQTQSKELSPRNELFLTLMKLRLDNDNHQLGCLFGISQASAESIFETWLNFMFFQLQKLKIRSTKAVNKSFMPKDVRTKHAKTRVILDPLEIPIKRPTNGHGRSATRSSYKNRKTLKVIVGISAKGSVTFTSDTYGGSTSDREILERSKIVPQNAAIRNNDSLMADCGFHVQDLRASKNVQMDSPTTEGVNQLPVETVARDSRIASIRVHVEQVIGLAKTYKMLRSVLHSSETKYRDKITFVCYSLCNFHRNIMPN